MKLILKRGRLIKISLVTLAVIFAIPFFLSKPKSQLSNRPRADHKVRPEGAFFKDGTLGNYEPTHTSSKTGPGEWGKPHFPSPSKQSESQQGMMEYGINVVASDEIAMNRSIPDTRMSECKYWNYPTKLPKASVIIVFHNEGWSPLLRTVHTVINRSPPQFLEEVLLVDDFSDKDRLKEPLDDYIRQFNGKVRLIRNKEREGLIRTRSIGAAESRGDVIVFLDAHCEVNVNWLPPLLSPIADNRKVMTVPIIDGVNKDTLEYKPVYSGGSQFRGIFEWGMLYKETEVPQREKALHQYKSEPYSSPTHAGGLFAMDRGYFLELGAYDPGLLVWGGENFELSFKTWQCGGRIVWVPCSRVGHIYRAFMPYSFGNLGKKKKGPLITLNYKRVIEVWMDEYKEYFYTREPLAQFLDSGDVKEQLALRNRLGCKDFKWFMENVAYDVLDKYPLLPKNLHWGELHNKMSGQCMDSMGMAPPTIVGVSHCHGMGSNQLFRLNAQGQLGVGERCIDADQETIKLVYCSMGTVDGPWSYDENLKTLLHKLHKKCVALVPDGNQLKFATCDSNDATMQWEFQTVHPKY